MDILASLCFGTSRRLQRKVKGQSLIEFALAIVVFFPFVLLSIDVFLIITAMQINDASCAEAARLASIGDPRLLSRRATQIINRAGKRCPEAFRLELLQAATTIEEAQLDRLVPYGGKAQGTVTVTTAITIKPLILSCFLGRNQLRLLSRKEYPSTYIQTSAIESNADKNRLENGPRDLVWLQ